MTTSSAAGGNPVANRVGREYAASAARGAMKTAGRGALEFKLYVQENPASVKVMLFISALLLAIFSFMGIINIFNVFKPGQFLINFYNFLFAVIIMVLEGKESWCGFLHERIFRQAAFLSNPCGKGWFVLWVGTMIFCVDLEKEDDFWKIAYVLLGLAFCSLGSLMIFNYACPNCCGRGDNDTGTGAAGVRHQQFQDDRASANNTRPGAVSL